MRVVLCDLILMNEGEVIMIKILKESTHDMGIIDTLGEEIKEALGAEKMLEEVLNALDYDTKIDVYDYIKRTYDLDF